MSWRPVAAFVVAALLVLAACASSGGDATAQPTTGSSGGPPTTASPHASASPGAMSSPASSGRPAASPPPGASVCRQSGDPGTVAVSIADYEFKPASIAAKLGQVVDFSNTGFEPHNATVDAGCGTRTLRTGESDGLVFSVAGTYKFACTVHAWMTGTFTIAP